MKRGSGSPTKSGLHDTQSLDSFARFFKAKSNTLLVKGLPGTGKTTLALQLMEVLGNLRGIYISSRVSEGKGLEHFPWLPKVIGNGGFADARLGNMDDLLETILNALSRRKVPILVLDTWDGIAKEVSPIERLKDEKTLFAMADNLKTRLIFVSEEPQATTIDYLVDGIVELKRVEENGRIFRTVEILKMRGVPIVRHRYLYTLDGGKFTYFNPYRVPSYEPGWKPKAMQDLEAGYSFGNERLDRITHGLPRGGAFSIEIDDSVPPEASQKLQLLPISSFLSSGRSVLVIPAPGASGLEKLVPILSGSETKDSVKRIRVMASGPEAPAKELEFYSKFEFSSKGTLTENSKAISLQIAEIKKNSRDGVVLISEDIRLLENRFATQMEGLAEVISQRLAVIQRTLDTMLITIPSSSELGNRLLSMCQGHLKLSMKDETLVLIPTKPPGPAYVMEHLPNLFDVSLSRIV